MGNVVCETDELGNVTRAEYDRLGRVIEQKTPFEEKDGTVYYSVKKVLYDDNGNVVKERVISNASGSSETYNEVRLHDLRHSCASMLIAQGVGIKVIQEWLVHSSISTGIFTGICSSNKRFQQEC